MREKPRIKARRTIARSRLFTIEEMDLQFSNGAHRVYERIRHHGHGAVLVVAITPEESLILVREYGAGTDRYELAFPKGLIDAGEDALAAANRELQEETGFAAKTLTAIRDMTLAPGYFGARLDVVLAEDLYPSCLEGDEPEPPEVIKWPMHQLDELMYRPDFSEARSIAALFLVQAYINKRNKS